MLTVDSILKTFSKQNSIQAGYIYNIRRALMAVLETHIVNRVKYCSCYIVSQGETTFSAGDIVTFKHTFFKRYIPLNDMLENISLKSVIMVVKCDTCGALSLAECAPEEFKDDIEGVCDGCNTIISITHPEAAPAFQLRASSCAGQIYDIGGVQVFLLHRVDEYWHCLVLESTFNDIPRTALILVPIQNLMSSKQITFGSSNNARHS